MNKETNTETNIPKKVIGVKSPDDAAPPFLPSSLPQEIPDSKYPAVANSFDVINDWEQIHGKKIRGKLREVSEYVAKKTFRRKNYPPPKRSESI